MGVKFTNRCHPPNLDKAAIAQTVRDCCVPESAISYYQEQVKESLATELEVEVV